MTQRDGDVTDAALTVTSRPSRPAAYDGLMTAWDTPWPVPARLPPALCGTAETPVRMTETMI